jgi:hypothetical protein
MRGAEQGKLKVVATEMNGTRQGSMGENALDLVGSKVKKPSIYGQSFETAGLC